MNEVTTTTSSTIALRDQLKAMPISANGMIQLQTLGEAYSFAELLVRGEFAPKGTTVEKAVVSILAGNALGLSPLEAVQNISTINGRPTLWGDAQIAVCKASPAFDHEKIEILKGEKTNEQGVRYSVWRKGVEEPFVEEFTLADKTRAGFDNKPGPWQQFPRRMMLNRARSFALRNAFPDVLKGFRATEEALDDEIDINKDVVIHPAAAAQPAEVKQIEAAAAQPAATVEQPKKNKLRDLTASLLVDANEGA